MVSAYKGTLTGTKLMDISVDPEHGDYYRVLLPGTYALKINADGFQELVVPPFKVNAGPAQVYNFTLQAKN